MGKKKIEKLVPVKKTVTKPDQGTFSQTFYVDPLKKKSKSRKLGKGEKDTESKNTAKSEETGLKKRLRSEETGPDKKRKVDDKDGDKKMIPDDSHPFKDVKNFEDFGKSGIDPESAKQFFW